MTFVKSFAFGLSILAAPAVADGHATGNAEDGKSVFKKCKACHAIFASKEDVIVKGGKSAPNLYGLYNRVAGSDDSFKKFGKSLVQAGENGLIWTEAEFVNYVADPKKFLRTYLDDKSAKSNMSLKLKKNRTPRMFGRLS